MTLQTKLMSGFALTAVITLAVSAVGYWQADRLASAMYEVGVVRLPSIQGLDAIHEAMSAVQTAERTMLLPDASEALFADQRRLRDQAFAELERGTALYAPLPQTPDEADAWRAFVPALQAWRDEHAAVVSLVDGAHATGDASRLAEARTRSLGAANDALASARTRLASVMAINEAIASQYRAQSVDGVQERVAIQRFMLSSAAVGVIGAIALGVFFGRRFSRPIDEVSKALAQIARGQLHARIAGDSRDEIGAMGQAVNHLGGELHAAEIARTAYTSELLALNQRYERQQSALTALMHRYVDHPEHLRTELQAITEIIAAALDCERVSVWRFIDGGSAIVCDERFERSTSVHSSGTTFTRAEDPYLFRDMDDAIVFEVTGSTGERPVSPLEAYLQQSGIRSYVRAQIRAKGGQVGALTCAHVGATRQWHRDEQTFLVAAANLIAALMAQAEGQRLEAQLRQAQKMEAFGQLAGGVAHDFNNILTVILGRAYQLADDERTPADLREAASEILRSGERASDLTRQLLAFSRRQAIQMKDVDLNAIVSDMARMLQRLIGADVSAELSLMPGPVHIRADAGMIDQVLLNLAVNARDAMPTGGRISIETWNEDLDKGSFVRLRVIDTGAGISPEHLPRIFEPFFTTKEPGKGTGLGLATTYSIVQQHGGWIDVSSTVGVGTTFTVFLPRIEAASTDAVHTAGSTLPRGHETILVVEDEDDVRSILVHGLTDLGYQVIQAATGPAALAAWSPAIELVLTDMIMPDGLTGTELVRRLRASRPELKVIYVSGYVHDSGDVVEDARTAVLPKPFRLVELAAAVRRMLDAPQSTATKVAQQET